MAKLVAPPPNLTISQWADQERRLSAESSPEPGRWITDRAPYQRGPMDAVTDPSVRKVVLKMSAQVGKTELILNIIGFFIHHDPSPMLVLQPTLDLAEAFSKDRLAPMIRDTPALSGKVKDAKSRDSGNTLLQKKFAGGHITMAGANSPSSLASRPVRIVLCDETCRFPSSAGTEGDPVKLAQKRANNFFNRIFVECSTPTRKGVGIDPAYEESDRREYDVPCPLCGLMQPLKFAQLRYEGDNSETLRNVRYQCVGCLGEFTDAKKHWMLSKGEWNARAPFTGIAGFHINELYSPWRKWEQTVLDYLEAKGDGEKLKVWTNTALGEVYEEKGEAPEWQRLYDRREDYTPGRVPLPGVFLTAGADVQKDRIEVEIVAWAKDKSSWSIDYKIISGDTSSPDPWLELDKVLDNQWPHESGTMLPIRMLAIDSGFNTQQVYQWARKKSVSRVMAIKGQDSSSTILGQPTPVDIRLKDRKRIRRGFSLWPVGVSLIKSELYGWLRLPTPLDGESYPPGYCHFPQYGDEYFRQLTAEQLVSRLVRGYRKYMWEKTQERNEALDTRVYNRAAAAAVGIDRFTPSEWEILMGQVGAIDPATVKRRGKEGEKNLDSSGEKSQETQQSVQNIAAKPIKSVKKARKKREIDSIWNR